MTEEKAKYETKELITRPGEGSMFFDLAKYEHAKKVGTLLSTSSMVPDQFRGGQNLGNCIIALNLAERMGVDPFMLMQNMYIVHGRPGIEAKLAIALVNGSGKFTPLQFKFEGQGKDRKCTCYATHRETKEECSQTVTWEMVEAEGWNENKKNRTTGEIIKSKWNTMPDLMFQYRSAMFFTRIYCPEVIMGFRSVEEIIDMTPDNGDVYQAPIREMWTEKSPEEAADLIKVFNDSIPSDINKDLLKTFLEKGSETWEKTIEEIKAEACEDLEGFWTQYRIWEKNQKGEKKEEAPWNPYTSEIQQRYKGDKPAILEAECKKAGIEIKGLLPREVHEKLLQAFAADAKYPKPDETEPENQPTDGKTPLKIDDQEKDREMPSIMLNCPRSYDEVPEKDNNGRVKETVCEKCQYREKEDGTVLCMTWLKYMENLASDRSGE